MPSSWSPKEEGGSPAPGSGRVRVRQGPIARSTPRSRSSSTTMSVVCSAMRRNVVSLPPTTVTTPSGSRRISCSREVDDTVCARSAISGRSPA